MLMADHTTNVLIVDDDMGDRAQIRRMLSKSGLRCELAEASNMDEALAACETQAFDAVIVDYHMPGVNGLSAITRLRERAPFMPIIMSTGQGDEKVAAEAIKLGALDYLPKSQIDEVSVRRAVDSAVERAGLNRKLAEQKEALENFAKVLAHDLKNPISTIMGFASLIEDELEKETANKEKAAEHCRRVGRAARTMQKMIDMLRQYTQLDAHVEFGPVPMRGLVEEVLAAMTQTIGEHGATVNFGELPVVRGNAPQLVQLMQNLIGNAVKYCEGRAPVVDILARPHQDGAWLFEVRDNGIGIPKAAFEHVFAAFKRLHSPGRFEGTGLGLAICKKIIERHSGNVWCSSTEGQGTSFFFTLPDVKAPR
jgi:light-regulated signal transduction histidine kinase (bacteriophytochrome)